MHQSKERNKLWPAVDEILELIREVVGCPKKVVNVSSLKSTLESSVTASTTPENTTMEKVLADNVLVHGTFPTRGTSDEKSPSYDFVVYTDGSCSGNPGPGGWAYSILTVDGRDFSKKHGYAADTTNSRMELKAVIEALKFLPKKCSCLVVSDSQYVINTMTKGWKRGKNLDLWSELDLVTVGKLVLWQWIKGHNDNPYNEDCDKRAKYAMGFVRRTRS